MRHALAPLRPLLLLTTVGCAAQDMAGPAGPRAVRDLAPAAVSAVNGSIAFISERDGADDVFVMASNGSSQTNITNLPGNGDYYPCWSPDGTRIAFASDRAGNLDIHAMDPDGANVTNVSNSSPHHEAGPCDWSPDGTKIVYNSPRSGSYQVWVMDADGSNQTQLSFDGNVIDVSWSPDGTKIVYNTLSLTGGINYDVMVMDADGSNPVNITNSPDWEFQADWSPDGTRLAVAVVVAPDLEQADIVLMDPDGSNRVNITNSASHYDAEPEWSPDGAKIAFSSYPVNQYEESEVYVMNADGSNPVNLTQSAGRDYAPAWGIGTSVDGDSDGDGRLDESDNCPYVPNPGQDDLDRDGVGDACEESRGILHGDGTNRHDSRSDHPGASAKFVVELSANSPPSGIFTYDVNGVGRLTAESVEYLEVAGGRAYAKGMGRWNGLLRGWCLIGVDDRRRGDQLEVLIVDLGDPRYDSCDRPKLRFTGGVVKGGFTAKEGTF